MFKIRNILLGKPRNPLARGTRRNIALVAFLAWIGLGADGLSSSAYGPEQSFYALGPHYHLALYLSIMTAFTIFLISLAYNQVIKLFPNGGGGYQVASKLLGPFAGLVSGTALIIDYILTIAISIAAGTDALFSLIPDHYQPYKLIVEPLILLFLLFLNLRGAKESIKLLMTIFLGFFITHILIIAIGLVLHEGQLLQLFPATVAKTQTHADKYGWLLTLSLLMRAYSLGAGTYTGIEAVSNNVNILAEPRIKTGRLTMLYMAISLSLVAGGIMLLYLVWNVKATPGQTLNAVVFGAITQNWPYHQAIMLILLGFEAGILFIASNTGFLGGPAVLANMSLDSWVPQRFSLLSSRLVTQNSIIFFGLAAMVILLGTDGHVDFLVILYSMNVFLTFTMSLLGLTVYWWQHREKEKYWLIQIFFSFLALILCIFILLTTLIVKFEIGGWITIAITATCIVFCLIIKQHYNKYNKLKKILDKELQVPLAKKHVAIPHIDTNKPTAVFLVKEVGSAMHALLWAIKTFPKHFHNFVFISYGEVDIGSFGSEKKLERLQNRTDKILRYLVKYSQQSGIAAEYYNKFGTNAVDGIIEMAEMVNKKYSDTIYFSSRYIYANENWFTRLLHSDIGSIIQNRIQALGVNMLVLPLKLKV